MSQDFEREDREERKDRVNPGLGSSFTEKEVSSEYQYLTVGEPVDEN